jgi:hypothetical protein
VTIEAVGCCGAYCGTCQVLKIGACQGCKLGYANGERNIEKAKCKIKVCCILKDLNSCADCNEYETCVTIHEFHGKNSYKYSKYQQAIEYVRENGYGQFLSIADKWKNAYGKYE